MSNQPTRCTFRPVSISRENGVTIIEVMVSIAVGLFILAGVIQLYASTTQNSVVVSGSSTIQENARYVFSRLGKDVAQAGFGGCFNIAAKSSTGVSRFKSIVDGNNGAGELYDFSQYISGENDTNVNGLTFDSLTVRFASSSERHIVKSATGTTIKVADSTPFKQGDLVLVSDCSRTAMFKVANKPEATGELSFAMEVDSETYNNDTSLGFTVTGLDEQQTLKPGIPLSFVLGGGSGAIQYRIDTSAAGEAANQTCSSENPQYCALFRQTTTTGKGDELVEGVEQFDVEYGWQVYSSAGDTLFFTDATGVGGNWSLVDRVKITAVFNSVNRAPTNDGAEFISRTYSRTFMIQNQFPGDTDLRAAL